ncbi:MAG: AAA family ATPase [Oscillospiraceae bacterium]|nr:AAA family ATPase [Oscillospiraceae bacterium]
MRAILSDEIIEIMLDIAAGTALHDMSVCKNFNTLLASGLKSFLTYLLSEKDTHYKKRDLVNVKRVFYVNYVKFFEVPNENEQVTEHLQEFLENFSRKSPGQKMLCYFALLVSLMQVKGKKLYLLVDEPESHLHHERVTAVIEALRDLQENSAQVKIIIATHSHYIVSTSAFHELVFLHEKQIQKKSHTYKIDMLETLMGKSNENLLYDIYADAFCEFVAECTEPAPSEGAKKTRAYDELRSELHGLPVGLWLDFGAGQGRLAVNLCSISGRENYAETNCVAYEIGGSPQKVQEVRKTLEPLYKEVLINNELEQYVANEENKFSAVFLINVLHEIPITDWVETFKKIANSLIKDGRLIFCETMILSMGEQENFLVLDKDAICNLFSVKRERVGILKGKVIYTSINAEQLERVSKEKILEELLQMRVRYKDRYEKIRSPEESRKKAFYGCSCLNIEKAIGELNR